MKNLFGILKQVTIASCIIIFWCLFNKNSLAQVPTGITYQGFLQDANKIPLTGSYNLLFKIYDAETGGTAIWEENHIGENINNGVFSVILENLGALSFNTQYWLGITINSGTELIPRTKLTSVPYALSVPDKSITPEKINTDSAASGQALVFDGSNLIWKEIKIGGVTYPYTIQYTGGSHIVLMENLANSSTVRMVDLENYGAGEVLYLSNSKSSNSTVLTVWNDGTGKVARFASSPSNAEYAVAIESWSNLKEALHVDNSGSGGAAKFEGNVEIRGDLDIIGKISKSEGTFKIDHPLDPENKYLYHSFVESPDMMNVYNGNVTLNSNGDATVKLPEYFVALNKEFRYQLTCIGGYAPVFISEEISNNQFKISGGKAGLKVSWQVTGIRKDPYADKNRVHIEVEKPDKEKGRYLHYKEYNQPYEKSISALKDNKK